MLDTVPVWRDTAMLRSLHAVCIALLIACAAAAEPLEQDPYVVTIDLRPWIEQLRSDDLFEADPAIERLAALGDDAVPALHAALKTEGRQARVHLVEVLRDIRTPATLAPLAEAAADPDAEVRADALEALGRLGDERGRPALEAALLGDSADATRAAAAACRSLCTSPPALRRLIELALEERTAAFARSSLHDVAAGEHAPRVRALVDEIALPAMRQGPAEQRFRAALVVAEAGNAAAVPTLKECVAQPSTPETAALATMCIQALGASGSADAVALLAELARDGDGLRRASACAALAAFVGESATARAAYSECTQKRQAKE